MFKAPLKFENYIGIASNDMGTEKTFTKDAKGSSAITGVTRQHPTLISETISRHIMSEYKIAMRERSGLSTSTEDNNLSVLTFTQYVTTILDYGHILIGFVGRHL